ncbi:MAG: hypothetical protein MPJ50_14915 [Pirellulales bacterium]|nr:hypothetical protein [Pirellulales bacterium]
MPSLIGHLRPTEQQALLDDLNYLNMSEFRGFCDRHDIPYTIWIETASGEHKRTRDTDRKAIVLDRIRNYLKTGNIAPATSFAYRIVRVGVDPPAVFQPGHRLYYGWYNKKNQALMEFLKSLTGDQFRDGAVARLLMRDFWTAGHAPTLRQFATAWQKAQQQGLGEHPECAWLTDRAHKTAGKDWKAKRVQIASRVLAILDEIPIPRKAN